MKNSEIKQKEQKFQIAPEMHACRNCFRNAILVLTLKF